MHTKKHAHTRARISTRTRINTHNYTHSHTHIRTHNNTCMLTLCTAAPRSGSPHDKLATSHSFLRASECTEATQQQAGEEEGSDSVGRETAPVIDGDIGNDSNDGGGGGGGGGGGSGSVGGPISGGNGALVPKNMVRSSSVGSDEGDTMHPELTLAHDVEDAHHHTSTTLPLHAHTSDSTAASVNHNPPNTHPPQHTPPPISRPLSASTAWTERHNSWRATPVQRALSPPPSLTQRAPHLFTHSTTSLSHHSQHRQHHNLHPRRPHSAASASRSTSPPSPQPKMPQSPVSPLPSRPHSAAVPSTQSRGYPLPYLHTWSPPPESPPTLAVKGTSHWLCALFHVWLWQR